MTFISNGIKDDTSLNDGPDLEVLHKPVREDS